MARPLRINGPRDYLGMLRCGAGDKRSDNGTVPLRELLTTDRISDKAAKGSTVQRGRLTILSRQLSAIYYVGGSDEGSDALLCEKHGVYTDSWRTESFGEEGGNDAAGAAATAVLLRAKEEGRGSSEDGSPQDSSQR